MTNLGYMFDTNAFNRLLDGNIDVSVLARCGKVYATHIQMDEINKTPDVSRRAALIQVFQEATVAQLPTNSFVLDVSRLGEARLGGEHLVPTESAVWGVSTWGQAKWTAEDNLVTPIKTELDKLNGSKPNNVHDALIAETSIKNGFTLVTHDSDLFRVVTKFGSACANVHHFLLLRN